MTEHSSKALVCTKTLEHSKHAIDMQNEFTNFYNLRPMSSKRFALGPRTEGISRKARLYCVF